MVATVTSLTPPIRVAALYRFAPFEDCDAIRRGLLERCGAGAIRGTLIVAPEGINGTIAGSAGAIDAVLAHIRSLPGCAALDVKFSWADAPPFHRMKVRIKREIVTMGEPGIDPASGAGHYVAPEDWNALVDDPGTILIDTRNAYEVAAGSFVGAIDPRTRSFRDFPAWFRSERARLMAAGADGAPPRRVAMFCTGGIRCEKSTAFLRAEGIEDVYHLQGGILRYLETVPAEDSRWRGECFVFDRRVALGHGLAPGTQSLCHACRRPVDAAGLASPLYEEGVSCAACHGERDAAQRAGYAERHRQEALARQRGTVHVGAVLPRRAGGEA